MDGLIVSRSSLRVFTRIGRPMWILPNLPISGSGNALANMNSGQVKPGPFSVRNFHAQSAMAPVRQAVGPHQLACPGRRFIFQHFIMSYHCSGVSSRVSLTPFFFSMRVSWSGVKIDGMKNANRPRRSTS